MNSITAGAILQSYADCNRYESHTEPLEIMIKYHDDELQRIEKIDIGNWIDLRSADDIVLMQGQAALISLGVSIKLPEGYEAHIVSRSSTYKNFGIIQTNSIGIIDNSYSGTNDIWKLPVIAIRDTIIRRNDRICQFRIMRIMPPVKFSVVDSLDDTDRGGFGSTGIR